MALIDLQGMVLAGVCAFVCPVVCRQSLQLTSPASVCFVKALHVSTLSIVICGDPKVKPQKVTIVLHNKANIFETPRQLHHAA